MRIDNNVYVAQYTAIEDYVFLAPGLLIPRDPHHIGPKDMIGPTVKKGARIGADTILVSHVVIGEHSTIAARGVGTQDIPAGGAACGSPATVIKPIDSSERALGIVDLPEIQGKRVRIREYLGTQANSLNPGRARDNQ